MDRPQAMLRRRAATAGLGVALAAPLVRRARAATAITLGYTATLGFNAAFIAKDRGFFDQHGLNVDLVLITLNSNIPGAMMGGSIQVGGPTPTVLLQANDGGLDLVVVAGCAGLDGNNRIDGLMARTGAGITRASDCLGRKIGVPGLNAYYHVLVRKWLAENGVDWHRVNFVETAFSQSADVLRSGSVDAVATGEPFSTRIVAEGIGTTFVPTTAMAPPNTSSIFYAATRDWVKANPGAVPAFRQALAEAIRFQAADPQGARASAGKFIKLPPDTLASISLPVLQGDVTADQIRFWIDIMAQQDMIQEKPDAAKLLTP